MNARAIAAFAALIALLACGLCPADVFSEDFEKADPAEWTHAGRSNSEIVREDGKALLSLTGREQQSIPIPAEPLRDFVLQFEVRGPGGMQFRDGYKVFFKGNGEVWVRRPGSMLLDWIRTKRDMSEFNTIRVVCAGKIVRVYVNDTLEFEGLDHSPAAGRFALSGSGDFNYIVIDEDVPLTEALMATPRDAGANFFEEQSYVRMNIEGPRVPDIAHAYKIGEPVRMPIVLLNQSGDRRTDIRVRAYIDDFEGEVLAEPIEITFDVEGWTETGAEIDFGAIPPGFHRVQLELLHGDESIRTLPYPVFVGVPDQPVGFAEPELPFGLFLMTTVWKPFHAKTYWHAIASSLRENNFNIAVQSNLHRELPEIFEQYGMAVIERTDNRIDHPAVFAMLTGQTNPDRLTYLRDATNGKPLIVILNAESVGTGEADDPIGFMKGDDSPVRLMRIHPFRRDRDEWLNNNENANLPETLRLINEDSESGWWALLQAFGSAGPDGPFRNPTSSELRAQTHLALAFGAKGILYYSFQGNDDTVALVDYISLKPVDDKLEVLAELGGLIKKHSTSIRSFKPVGFLEVEPAMGIARFGWIDEKAAIYLVNTDTRQTGEFRILLPEGVIGREWHNWQNIFTGDAPNIIEEGGGLIIQLRLGPGEGGLLIHDRPRINE